MRVSYVTDIHLNFISSETLRKFCFKINQANTDAVIITGDITEAPYLEAHLNRLREEVKVPVYFVLGNHDYYRGSVKEVRALMCEKYANYWLPSAGVVDLSCHTALVGHDGWYDGGYGDWFCFSTVQMTDYELVEELRNARQGGQDCLYGRIRGLAKEAAEHVKLWATKAAETHKHVIIATHVPPFVENAVYDDKGPNSGKISGKNWIPIMSSEIMGNALLDLAEDLPETQFTVLCGHSHGNAVFQAAPNMVSITGYSDYGNPLSSHKIMEFQ